jgi:hypothetical protein
MVPVVGVVVLVDIVVAALELLLPFPQAVRHPTRAVAIATKAGLRFMSSPFCAGIA